MKKDLLPIRYTVPPEAHVGLWGGIGVLQGEKFARGYKLNRRFKKEWRPTIIKEYFHSELCNDGEYLWLDVTPRTLELIDRAGGFEDYILGTPVCELNSVLAYMLKRDMLRNINVLEKIAEEETQKVVIEGPVESEVKIDNNTCNSEFTQNVQFDSSNAVHVYEKYKKYQKPEKEIEWIGLPLQMALKKQYDIEVANNNPKYSRGMPLMEFRKQQMHSDSLSK